MGSKQLHMHAVERLKEPMADIRTRHRPAKSRVASVRAMIGL
jgi:hypothetical protein